MYGTQTVITTDSGSTVFENDVEMYGTQTKCTAYSNNELFENDVEMYGTQTIIFDCI